MKTITRDTINALFDQSKTQKNKLLKLGFTKEDLKNRDTFYNSLTDHESTVLKQQNSELQNKLHAKDFAELSEYAKLKVEYLKLTKELDKND